MKDVVNKILCGNAMDVLKQLPDKSVHCVLTSPPYWALRDYGTEPQVWDGDKNCQHEWGEELPEHHPGQVEQTKWKNNEAVKKGQTAKSGSFCSKCDAWRGSLGLEPTFELYIAHLVQIFDEVKRVLRNDGTLWVNLGDTYSSMGGLSKPEHLQKANVGNTKAGVQRGTRYLANISGRFDKNKYGGKSGIHCGRGRGANVPDKSLCQIPSRFAISMAEHGWILRNRIIWYKPNCMPASVRDRFTTDFEDIFFFVKSNDTNFWTNKKTLEVVSSQPKGIKGIEGIDWDWQDCPKCTNIIGTTKIDEEDAETMASPRARYHRASSKETCPRCKGTGRIKRSNWTGHDYYFEQQYDQLNESSLIRSRYSSYSEKTDMGIHGGINLENQKKIFNKMLSPDNPGRNRRCVWEITTRGYSEAHFAVFPEELCETPILSGCPEFVCKKRKVCKTCGKEVE